MAAIYYQPQTGRTIFKNGMHANLSVSIPFLANAVNANNGFVIVTDVTVQNRDTIQYFLTFDDFISYFYFGKGLGTLSISGVVFSDADGYFRGVNFLNNTIASVRGSRQLVSFGNAVFAGVVSNFTLRANSGGDHDGGQNLVEFNLQMDIIDHSMTPPSFTPLCR